MTGWAVFDDCPRGRGQKMANMSTVAIKVTFILLEKEAADEIHSHQEPLLLNIWGDTAAPMGRARRRGVRAS